MYISLDIYIIWKFECLGEQTSKETKNKKRVHMYIYILYTIYYILYICIYICIYVYRYFGSSVVISLSSVFITLAPMPFKSYLLLTTLNTTFTNIYICTYMFAYICPSDLFTLFVHQSQHHSQAVNNSYRKWHHCASHVLPRRCRCRGITLIFMQFHFNWYLHKNQWETVEHKWIHVCF